MLEKYIEGYNLRKQIGKKMLIITLGTFREAYRKSNILPETIAKILIKNQKIFKSFHYLELIELLEKEFGKEFWKGDPFIDLQLQYLFPDYYKKNKELKDEK